MTAAYVSATHSLQIGTDAGIRNQSINNIKQQLELIKLAEQTSPTNLSSYISNPGQAFCIDPASGGKVAADSTGSCTICADSSQLVVGFADSHGNCAVGEPSSSIAMVYDDTTKVFTSTAAWEALNGSGKDQSTSYYKLSDTAVSAAGPVNTLNTTFMVQSDINSPYGPQLDITANGTSIYSHQFGVGSMSQICSTAGYPPGTYTTPAPSFTVSPDDSLGETCVLVTLPLDLSSVPGATQVTFTFSQDRDVPNPLAPISNNQEDNNIILRSVGIPGKTLKVHSTSIALGPGLPPAVPPGSTLPPYSVWLVHNNESVTFDIL